MFRAFVLLTVMTVAAGPNAAAFCRAWCSPEAATADACRHDGLPQSAIVTSSDCCAQVGSSVPATIANDLRTTLSSPSGAHATLGLHFEFALPANHGRPDLESAGHVSFDNRPLATILRI